MIERADTVSFLWSELSFEFEQAYKKEPKDEQTIAGVYEYAAWCWHGSDYQGNNNDLITEVFGGFYEWLPRDPVIRRDMPWWLCLKEFEVLQAGPFRYFLGPDEHAQMLREFRQAKEKQSEHHLMRCSKVKLTF